MIDFDQLRADAIRCALPAFEDLHDILGIDGDYGRPTESWAGKVLYDRIDRGSLLSIHLKRRLIARFDVDDYVGFAPGLNVALNALLFRFREFHAFLPPALSNQDPFVSRDWISSHDVFRTRGKVLLHFDLFTSNAELLSRFLQRHGAALEEASVTFAVTDAPAVVSGVMIKAWFDREGAAARYFETPAGWSIVVEGVPADRLPDFTEVLREAQRLDQLERTFLADRAAIGPGEPSETDAFFVYALAADRLDAVGLRDAAAASGSDADFPRAAHGAEDLLDRISRRHRSAGPLSWIADLFHPRASSLPSCPEAARRWRTFFVWRAAAAYAVSFSNWRNARSQTIRLLHDGTVDWRDLRPLCVVSGATYDYFYTHDDRLRGHEVRPPRLAAAGLQGSRSDDDTRPRSIAPPLRPVTNHRPRIQFVVGQIKCLAAAVHQLAGASHVFRWLDIGCGTGEITNAVNFDEIGFKQYQIIGIDFGAEKIAAANAKAAFARTFYHMDLREMPHDILQSGFDLITAFEVAEHLFDPLDFVRVCAEYSRHFVMIGSPLNESCTTSPKQAHVFSYRRPGFEALLRHSNLHVYLSNELRVGYYSRGNDWLTVVGSTHEPNEYLR